MGKIVKIARCDFKIELPDFDAILSDEAEALFLSAKTHRTQDQDRDEIAKLSSNVCYEKSSDHDGRF